MSEPAFEDDQRFEILDKLAEGGMGVVYRARHVGLDKLVALKVLNTACNDDVAIMRFQNEAKTLSRLSHRSIAEVYDFGISKSGEPFMAIEFIEGVTLQHLLEERRRLTVDETLSMMIEISEALAHAHQRGVVHRDIKPSNIIIQEHGERVLAKLVDFGIAKDTFSDTGDLTRTGGLIGSPLYMSPEQTLGLEITPKSDMYSLGCVIYHCLIGKPPFFGETIFDTITKHREAPIPSMCKRLPEIPAELDDLVSKLLSKEPEKRYVSMTVVQKILTRILEGTVGDSQGNPVIVDIEDEEKAADMLKATLMIETGKDTQATRRVAIGIVVIGLVAVISIAFALSLSPKTEQTSTNIVLNPTVSTVVATGDAERDQNIRKMLKTGKTEYETFLWSEDNDVTDDDMKVFQGTRVAQEVNFNDLTIGDNALKYLADSPLVRLNLSNTRVKTLKFLPASKTLTFLNLNGTHVDDEALAKLSDCNRLRYLLLDETTVTAAGIRKNLKTVPLDEVTLNGCPNIDDSDRDALANEFPMWKVVPWKKGFENKNVVDVAAMTTNTLLAKGKPQKALEVWNQWNIIADSRTQSDPCKRLKIRALTNLAAIYDFDKKWDHAKKAADEAVALATKYGSDREHAEAFKALFMHHFVTQNFAEAAATGKTAVDYWQKGYGTAEMQLSENVGIALINAGKHGEAIPILEKSLQERENWRLTLDSDAEKLRRTRKLTNQDLQNCLNVRGSLANTLLYYCNCFRALNRNKEAKVAVDKAILTLEQMPNPNFDDLRAQCYLTLADINIRLNNLNSALTASKKAEALFKASRIPIVKKTFAPAALKQQEQIQALIKARPKTAPEATQTLGKPD